MDRTPVTSSSIKSVGHDGDVLEIEFHSGKVYRHAGVSVDAHAELMSAESIGRHYNAHIKGQFEHVLADDEQQG